jgi:hypothetical protein
MLEAFLVWKLLQLILKMFFGCRKDVSKAVTCGRIFNALDEPEAVFNLAV